MSLHGELAILNVNVICNIDITVQNQATIIFWVSNWWFISVLPETEP